MSALSIQPTYPIFTDIDGQPLEDGYIWIGTANLNPQTNPIAVYWDAALTLPAVQPIRTLAGYPANSGTPARLYVNSDYSIRVMNKNGSVVYSAPEPTEAYGGGIINASQVVYDPAGSGAVSTTVQAKLRETVSVKDYDAVGDGVADDTVAIQNMLNDASGKIVYFPAGTYKITSALSVTTLSDCTILGYGQATITGNYGRDLISFCDTTNFTLDGIIFDNQYVNAVLSGGAGCVNWTELNGTDCNIENVTVSNCTFTNPNTQNMALFVAFRTVQNPPGETPPQPYRTGLMKNFTIANNKFLNCGGLAMTIMNRQTSTDRYDCVSNVRVENNYANNLANVAGATFGFFVSLDGFGQDFYVLNNSITGHKGTAIECAGWIKGLIQGNTVNDGKGTHRMMALDGGGVFNGPGVGTTAARVSEVRVIGNACITDQSIYDYVIGADYCSFSDNIYRMNTTVHDGAIYVSDATHITFDGCQFITDAKGSVKVGDGTATVTRYVEFENCVFDNSAATGSPVAVIIFDGSGAIRNRASGVIRQPATGLPWTQLNSATLNSVDNNYYPIDGSYTPTTTIVTNFAGAGDVVPYVTRWFRVGDMVTVFGRVDVTPTASGADTGFRMSLPIASNFANTSQLAGSAASIYPSQERPVGIFSNQTFDEADFRWVANDTNGHPLFFQFSYPII
jgi:hypothetical protein